jgi:hypothetical protein
MTRAERLEYWRERLSHYQPGEMGVVEWCRLNGIGVKSFYRWRRILEQPGDESPVGEWLAVACDTLPAPCPEPTSSGVSICIGAATIEIARQFDTSVLACVVRVLQEAATC